MRLRQNLQTLYKRLSLLCVIGIFCMFSVTAFAAGAEEDATAKSKAASETVISGKVRPVVAEIPVSVIGKNTEEAFSIRLELEESEFQAAEQNLLMLKDKETGNFRIRYVYPGTYHMKIYQEAGKDKNTSYDATEYVIDAYVTEDEEGLLGTELVAYVKDSEEKLPEISFKNEKKLPTTPGPASEKANTPKTGDSTDITGYAALLLAATLGLLAVIVVIRRREGR